MKNNKIFVISIQLGESVLEFHSPYSKPLLWANGNEHFLKKRCLIKECDDVIVGKKQIPDNSFICDICNQQIIERPFLIVLGNALCHQCRKRINLKDGKEYSTQEIEDKLASFIIRALIRL